MKSGSKIVRYWCMYGPIDSRGKKLHTLPSVRPPKQGPGSRLLAQTRRLGKSAQRGCLCHFQVVYQKANPTSVLIRWAEREHIDKNRKPCHGTLDPDARSVHCDYAKHLSKDCLLFVRNFLRAGVPPMQIIEEHYREIKARCRDVPNRQKTIWKRDLQLLPKDVHNVKRLLQKQNGLPSSKDDHIATDTWIRNHPEEILLYQPGNSTRDVPFMLVWAAPWMISNLAKHGHEHAISMDSTFATNMYEYHLFTVLYYDAFQNGAPGCWALLQRNKGHCITEFLEALKLKLDKVRNEELGLQDPFKPTCFIVDDAKEEHIAIKAAFPGTPILLCLYHVRRSWIRQIYIKIKSRPHRVDMNEEMAKVMYGWHKDDEAERLSIAFMNKWANVEPVFIDYYRNEWHGRLQWWVKQYRKFNHNNQNTNGAVERWHRVLKGFLFSDRKDKKGRTIAWLLWTMHEKVELAYWVRDKLKHHGRVRNKSIEKQVQDCIYNAKLIPDEDVFFFEDSGLRCAHVKSQSEEGIVYELISYDKKHATCSCGDAIQGNMCKHQIKCLTLKGISEADLLHILGAKMGTEFGGMDNLPDIDDGGVEDNIIHGPVEDEEAVSLCGTPLHSAANIPTEGDATIPGAITTLATKTRSDYIMAMEKFLPTIVEIPQLMDEGYKVMTQSFKYMLDLKARLEITGAFSMASIHSANLERFEPIDGSVSNSIACQKSWVDKMHEKEGMKPGRSRRMQENMPTTLQAFTKNKPSKPRRSMHQVLEDEELEEVTREMEVRQNSGGRHRSSNITANGRSHRRGRVPFSDLTNNAHVEEPKRPQTCPILYTLEYAQVDGTRGHVHMPATDPTSWVDSLLGDMDGIQTTSPAVRGRSNWPTSSSFQTCFQSEDEIHNFESIV